MFAAGPESIAAALQPGVRERHFAVPCTDCDGGVTVVAAGPEPIAAALQSASDGRVLTNPVYATTEVTNSTPMYVTKGTDSELGDQLLDAAEEGDVDAIREVLRKPGIDIDYLSGGMHALFVASTEGHAAAVELLLRSSANVNQLSGGNGKTALLKASVRGHTEVVKMLLDAGAKDIEKTWDHANALFAAAFAGRLAAMQLLIDHGSNLENRLAASPHMKDQDAKYIGSTPLIIASFFDQPGAVELLLGAGADRTARSENGQSALDVATSAECRRLLQVPPNVIPDRPADAISASDPDGPSEAAPAVPEYAEFGGEVAYEDIGGEGAYAGSKIETAYDKVENADTGTTAGNDDNGHEPQPPRGGYEVCGDAFGITDRQAHTKNAMYLSAGDAAAVGLQHRANAMYTPAGDTTATSTRTEKQRHRSLHAFDDSENSGDDVPPTGGLLRE